MTIVIMIMRIITITTKYNPTYARKLYWDVKINDLELLFWWLKINLLSHIYWQEHYLRLSRWRQIYPVDSQIFLFELRGIFFNDEEIDLHEKKKKLSNGLFSICWIKTSTVMHSPASHTIYTFKYRNANFH